MEEGEGPPICPVFWRDPVDIFVENEMGHMSADILAILAQEFQHHAHIDLHQGKTQVWNRG